MLLIHIFFQALHSKSYSVDKVCIDLAKKSNEITQFLDKVEKIRIEIDNINTNTEEIKKLNSIILSLPRGRATSNSGVEDRKGFISHTIIQVHSHIKEIERTVEKDKETPIENLPTLARVKIIQHATLVSMFSEALRNYNEMLLKYQERCKAIVHQQLRIIDKAATSDELEDLLEKDKAAVFVNNIVADTLKPNLLCQV
ncbi:Syntaxin-1A [Zootermopsis nevadensis]|uniref:Syntaxin-1A n=1 Tax=Zootermopsis nevadensis TaxID=136037 RepID=A0A067QZT1_ZOONE|nr:Syntaxin-1A [Zootermopsis nevadensis]